MFNFNQKQATDWRGKLENLKAMREKVVEYSTNVPGLAPILKKEFDAEQARVSGEIKAGAIQEFRQSLDSYFDASRRVDNAKTGEMSRWDMPKVAAEMSALKMLVENILQADENPMAGPSDKGAQIRAIFEEAQAGSLERKRAADELFSHILNSAVKTSAKMEANRLEFEARKRLEELRTTEDIIKAQEAQQSALTDLLGKKQQLAETGEALGDNLNSPFAYSDLAKAYKQVQLMQNESGGNDVTILPEDSPEVSGVDWSKRKEGEK